MSGLSSGSSSLPSSHTGTISWEEESEYPGEWSSAGSSGSDKAYITFSDSYDRADKVLAWVRLFLGSAYIVLGSYALVCFYRSRWILEIRTRSARLVLLGGAALVLSYVKAINASCLVIWGAGFRWFWSALVLFFVTPVLYGSYVCRALRLAVVFHPQVRRTLPWLIPERNYVSVLLTFGLMLLAVPIYHEFTLEEWEVIPQQTKILGKVSLFFVVCLVAIYPFIRKVDDMFNISKELIVVTILLVILTVAAEIVVLYGDETTYRWLGPSNLSFLFGGLVFVVSVLYPLRRLAMEQLAASKRNLTGRVLLHRREASTGSQATYATRVREMEIEDVSGRTSQTSRTEEGGGGAGLGSVSVVSSRGHMELVPRDASFASNATHSRNVWGTSAVEDEDMWDFERLASTPLVAAAFEEFARKALCYELVVFLIEVSRYQNGDYSLPTSLAERTQYEAFCRIATTFIRSGSPDEVNISDGDKKRILSWVSRGREAFEEASEGDRRLLFAPAYTEVKNMLEANLLLRFLRTEEFESVRVRRENLTAMMDSPP